MIAGLAPTPDPDDEDDKPDEGSAPSVTAIPKAKGKVRKDPPSEGDMEPEPSV